MKKITKQDGIIPLIGDQKNELLYEWISVMPIQKESRFSVYCPEVLLEYLKKKHAGFIKTMSIYSSEDEVGAWLYRSETGDHNYIEQLVKGLCFTLYYSPIKTFEDWWIEVGFHFYEDCAIAYFTFHEPSDMNREDIKALEKDIIDLLKQKSGFEPDAKISWVEAYEIIKKLNCSGIPLPFQINNK